MRAKLSAGVLVVCVVAALWVGAPEGTLSYLLRSPLVLIRDTIASIIDHLLGSNEPAPAAATRSSPFIDPARETSAAEEPVPAAAPASPAPAVTPAAAAPPLPVGPLQAAEQHLPLPPSWYVLDQAQASEEAPVTEEPPATEEPPDPIIQLPGVEVPGVEVPGVEVPGVEVPGVEVPGTEVPGIDPTLPGIETPKL
ncbi:MAG TPA: hypothetical protein VFW08_07660 [bacterium]|nr:hypothetical protein [bacterium]